MRRRIEWLWEELDENSYRAKVIGGWLVSVQLEKGKEVTSSICFVPDKDHEWHILPPKEDIQIKPSDIPY